MIKFSFITHLL